MLSFDPVNTGEELAGLIPENPIFIPEVLNHHILFRVYTRNQC